MTADRHHACRTLHSCAPPAFEYGGDEHDVIRCRDGGDPGLALGEKTELVPSHCDTAVNLYDVYHAVRGGQVEAVWPIEAPG